MSVPLVGFGQCSPHFWWSELRATQVRSLIEANREALDIDLDAQFSLRVLCVELLEPIRAWWGRPLVINSAFRFPALNTAIGGSPTSQHMLGQAADFTIPGVPLDEVFERIVESRLVFGQAILEPIGPGARWIHLSTGTKRQVIR